MIAKDKIFIVVLGGGINLQGNLPTHQTARLEKAIEIYKNTPNSKIVPSGKYSFLYEEERPPFTEAQAMKNYLTNEKIDSKDIILEQKSKDTIGNAYYLKKYTFKTEGYKKLIIITSNFHLERVEFIFHKVFERENIEFIGVEDKVAAEKIKPILERQEELLVKTKKYLKNMKRGDLSFLDNKIYKTWYYREPRPAWVREFVAKGK